MSEAATLEAPAETEAETPASEDSTTVTGEQAAEVQSDTTAESETPEQHLAALDQQREEAQAAEVEQKAEQRAQEILRKQQQDGRDRQRQAERRSAGETALAEARAIRQELGQFKIVDSEGSEYEYDGSKLENVINKYSLKAYDAAQEQVQGEYHEAIATNLGEQTEAFWKEAETLADEKGDISVAALLDLYAEKRALTRKAVTSMSLEDAKKASPKLARELTDALKAEYEKGREHPLPAGEPDTTGGGSSTYSSEHALNVAFNNGEISRDQYADQYKRLTGHAP